MSYTEQNIRLTSAEIAQLWSNYMGDSMAIRILDYFLRKVEDTEIREILEFSRSISEKHLKLIPQLFKSDNFPVPHGFTDEDVNLDAARMYSDTAFLIYLKNAAKHGLTLYSIALASSAREDVREFFTKGLTSTAELYNKAAEILLQKGLFIRAPYIPTPETAEYVHKESFLSGLMGDRRPLNAAEINHLYNNIQTNAFGKAFIAGFAQCAQSEEIRGYFLRGKDIAHKQIEVFSSYLRDEDLPAPMTWDSDVMASTEAPFSDKLMLFHITGLNAAALTNYGAAMSVSMRRDISASYTRLAAEIAAYSNDGAELLIKYGWMEKLPGNVDRRVLANKQ
ncbi:DUF3231 family protein [Paenibacillus tarimensis]|uniref:DUF3231 family protein n=1 Tax=Paenibacillus tarimensis TaxID=416012 RepID=UPI001F21CE75|nr:DUF3231 family protein [Paenibacillus tarimensis]MCF2943068.1 DUF3231 family protein [Paenibacillus tarimensis]